MLDLPVRGCAEGLRRRARGALVGACALLLATAGLPALAQEDPGTPTPGASAPPEPIGGSHRRLAGHRFEPSSLVEDPFASSSFGIRVQYSYGKARSHTVSGTPPDLVVGCCEDQQYAGVLQEIEGSMRLADWLSLRAGLGALTYSGLNKSAVLVVGSGIKTGGHLELVPGIDLGARARGALLLGVSAEPELNLLVLSALLDAYHQGDVESLDVVLTSRTVTFGAGVSVAWAPTHSLGLTTAVQLLVPRKSGSGAYGANGLSAAVAADLQLGQLPLGLSAAYRIITPLGSSDFRLQQDLRAGLSYTAGPSGLSMRGELGVTRLALRQDLPANAVTLETSLRYDW